MEKNKILNRKKKIKRSIKLMNLPRKKIQVMNIRNQKGNNGTDL